VVLRSRCVVLCTLCTRLHTGSLGPQPQQLVVNTICSTYNLYSWRWVYRCPKHVEIFMIINHNCCIKLVPLVIYLQRNCTAQSVHASFHLELFSPQQIFRGLACIEACCTSCTGLLFVSDCDRNIKVSINCSKSSECRISWKILGVARVVAERRAYTCLHSKPYRRMFVNFRYRGPEHKSQVTNNVFTNYFYEGTAYHNRCASFTWALQVQWHLFVPSDILA